MKQRNRCYNLQSPCRLFGYSFPDESPPWHCTSSSKELSGGTRRTVKIRFLLVFQLLLDVQCSLVFGMPVHTPVTQPGIYFITFTCHKWFPLLELTRGYDLVYKWFDIISGNGHRVTAYVIMPNHLHLLLYYAGGAQSLNTVIGNGKRLMAYDIIKRSELQNQLSLLTRLRLAVQITDKTGVKTRSVEELI